MSFGRWRGVTWKKRLFARSNALCWYMFLKGKCVYLEGEVDELGEDVPNTRRRSTATTNSEEKARTAALSTLGLVHWRR